MNGTGPISKWRWLGLCTLLVAALATGVAIGSTPPATERWLVSLALAAILPLATLATLIDSIAYFQGRRPVLGTLMAILTAMLMLLSLAAWDQFHRLG